MCLDVKELGLLVFKLILLVGLILWFLLIFFCFFLGGELLVFIFCEFGRLVFIGFWFFIELIDRRFVFLFGFFFGLLWFFFIFGIVYVFFWLCVLLELVMISSLLFVIILFLLLEIIFLFLIVVVDVLVCEFVFFRDEFIIILDIIGRFVFIVLGGKFLGVFCVLILFIWLISDCLAVFKFFLIYEN